MLGLEDEAFIRGSVPMTKRDVRILSVVKLQLQKDSVVYDIGAGTGSVSVEMAFQCPEGRVYSIERKPEAQSLLTANRDKFHLENMIPVEGSAPEVLGTLVTPTHAFIGGSGGRLIEIIEYLRSRNPAIRIVVNAVTLETLTCLRELGQRYPEYADMDLVQVGITRSHKVGGYHMLQAENPVWIAAFGGCLGETEGRESGK